MNRILWIGLMLSVTSVALAQEQPAPPAEPVPESAGPAYAAETVRPNADPLAAERQALEQLTHKYDRQIRDLQELALEAKGADLADLQRRIEELKTRHAAESLDVRLRVARETGNERRLQQMEKLAEELDKPRPAHQPTRESRQGEDR